MGFLTLCGYVVVLGLWAALVYREGGVGIGFRFMYGTNLFLYFLFGPLLGEVFGTSDPRFRDVPMEDAVQLALLALFIYVLAAYVGFPALLRRRTLMPPDIRRRLSNPVRLRSQIRVATVLMAVGFAYLPLHGTVRTIPTLGAVIAQIGTLVDVGMVMLALHFGCTGRTQPIVVGGVVFAVKHLLFASITGHAGTMFVFGMVIVFLVVYAFRVRVSTFPLVAGLAFLAFIPASYWLAGRQQLRDAIRDGAGADQQIDITMNIFLNPAAVVSEQSLVDSYRGRGDFSDLMASALAHTPAREPYARGDTYLDAFTAVVPRALWPDKPYKFGGSVFVARFTGLVFAEGTSVGMNYMFEMYANFGYDGVVVGMAVIGFVLAWMEHLYYTRGIESLSLEFTLILTAWTVCFMTDKFAEACMAVIPGLVLCRLVTYALAQWTDIPYLMGAPRRPSLGPRR